MQEKDHSIQHVDNVGSNSPSEVDEMRGPTSHMKHNTKGVLLVPQPSDDPRDPLVWMGPQHEAAFSNSGIRTGRHSRRVLRLLSCVLPLGLFCYRLLPMHLGSSSKPNCTTQHLQKSHTL